MAYDPTTYYPHRPGGPPGFLPAVPRVRHDNFDTEKVIEDRVRNLKEFQGINEQEMWGYIQNEIEYARTNRIGLKTDKGDARVNTSADTGPS